MHSEHSEISSFLAKYSLSQRDPETIILQSRNAIFLAKQIQLDSHHADIDNVIETLEQHQTLSQNHLLTLLNYSIIAKPNSTIYTIKTLYQYASLSLKQEIINRKAESARFNEQQLWAIVYSVVKSLEYLQRLNIGYGVLGCDKIFIDKKIKLIDPSAIAQDPLALAPHRLYSPQVINHHSSINILKSDVFVLGLCLLQAILLIEISSSSMPRYDETKLNIYIEQVETLYSAQIANLIRQMLQYCPDDRPTFSEIREYLENTLQMTQYADEYFNPLAQDTEDKENQLETFEGSVQEEAWDMEEEDDRSSLLASLNEYQQAKLRFLTQQDPNTPLQENSSRYTLADATLEGEMGPRKTSKYIKEKLVKKIDPLDLQFVEVNGYRRSKQSFAGYDKSSNSNLFTNPKLLEQIQRELKNIANNRSQMALKQNFYSCNF